MNLNSGRFKENERKNEKKSRTNRLGTFLSLFFSGKPVRETHIHCCFVCAFVSVLPPKRGFFFALLQGVCVSVLVGSSLASLVYFSDGEQERLPNICLV